MRQAVTILSIVMFEKQLRTTASKVIGEMPQTLKEQFSIGVINALLFPADDKAKTTYHENVALTR